MSRYKRGSSGFRRIVYQLFETETVNREKRLVFLSPRRLQRTIIFHELPAHTGINLSLTVCRPCKIIRIFRDTCVLDYIGFMKFKRLHGSVDRMKRTNGKPTVFQCWANCLKVVIQYFPSHPLDIQDSELTALFDQLS